MRNLHSIFFIPIILFLKSGIADGGPDELRSAAQDAGGKKNYSSIESTNQ